MGKKKYMIQVYAVYKRHTSESKTQIIWKYKNEKNIYRTNSIQKRAGVAILISEKIDFKTKIITRNKKGCSYNDKRVYPSGKHNSYKYMCT